MMELLNLQTVQMVAVALLGTITLYLLWTSYILLFEVRPAVKEWKRMRCVRFDATAAVLPVTNNTNNTTTANTLFDDAAKGGTSLGSSPTIATHGTKESGGATTMPRHQGKNTGIGERPLQSQEEVERTHAMGTKNTDTGGDSVECGMDFEDSADIIIREFLPLERNQLDMEVPFKIATSPNMMIVEVANDEDAGGVDRGGDLVIEEEEEEEEEEGEEEEEEEEEEEGEE